MKDLKFAKEFSRRVHAGQVDKAGVEYWKHPKTVAEMCGTDLEKIVAYLHDVVEDTDVTIGMVRSMFGDEVGDAVELITHPDGLPYMDQIKRLSGNRTARHVKEADLRHNMDLSRIPNVTEKDLKRREKYVKALVYLESIDIDELKGEINEAN